LLRDRRRIPSHWRGSICRAIPSWENASTTSETPRCNPPIRPGCFAGADAGSQHAEGLPSVGLSKCSPRFQQRPKAQIGDCCTSGERARVAHDGEGGFRPRGNASRQSSSESLEWSFLSSRPRRPCRLRCRRGRSSSSCRAAPPLDHDLLAWALRGIDPTPQLGRVGCRRRRGRVLPGLAKVTGPGVEHAIDIKKSPGKNGATITDLGRLAREVHESRSSSGRPRSGTTSSWRAGCSSRSRARASCRR